MPMTPTNNEKSEWSRMARAAYATGRNAIGHKFSGAAALSSGCSILTERFDALQREYRAWLCFNEWSDSQKEQERDRLLDETAHYHDC